MQISCSHLVKVLKVLNSFFKKDDFVTFTFFPDFLNIQVFHRKDISFSIPASVEEEVLSTLKIQLGQLSNIAKLTKKDQVGYISSFLQEDLLKHELQNGLTFYSKVELVTFQKLEQYGNFLYLDPATIACLSKVLKNQKDYKATSILDFGFLVEGERQITFLPFAEENGNLEATSFIISSSQLNALVSVNEEIGVNSSNKLVWGSEGSKQLDLFSSAGRISFQFPLEPASLRLSQFSFSMWKELKHRFEREKVKQCLEINRSKELSKLVVSAKSGVVDPYDLCVISTNSEENTIAISIYENKSIRNSLSFTCENIEFDFEVNIQVKHLLSLLDSSNNTVFLQYLSKSDPIYCKSDLGLETIIVQSLLV